jgi:hypothetical protein
MCGLGQGQGRGQDSAAVKKGASRQGHLWIFSFVESSGEWSVISGQFTTSLPQE